MREFHIGVTPMGAVRMTRRGKYTSQTAQRYLSAKDAAKWHLKQQTDGTLIDYPIKITATFFMPIPPSWSKKDKAGAEGMYHKSKPDIDNLQKTLFDAANGIIWKDDALVVQADTKKVYSKEPGIVMTVERAEESA